MAAALSLLAIANFAHQKHDWPWLAVLALCLATSALFFPDLLKPINKLWYRFGMLLHAVVNPVVMAALFYAAIWPTGLVFRLRHTDLLRLKREPDSDTYWIVRDPPGPLPETMNNQF